MGYFIPKDTSELLKRNNLEVKDIDNFSLKLNKFIKVDYNYNKNKYNFSIKNSGATNIKPNKFEKYYNSIKSIYSNSLSILATNNWRLALGIGSTSVYETSITLHHIYGVPYIPAQSIRGSLRSFIIVKYFGGDEDKAFEDDGFVKIFGSNDQQAKVIFFDAFTKESKIQLDIMNNHYQEYYNNLEFPTDTQNPNPINFLTLKGSKFEIVIATKESVVLEGKKFKGDILDCVKDEIYQSLEVFGIGAKTSVGYGYFNIQKSEEEKALEIMRDTEKIATVEAFIEKYPKSRYIEEAKKKKEKIEEKIKEIKEQKKQKEAIKKWEAVLKVDKKYKKRAFEDYIKNYPNSPKIEEAKKELEKFQKDLILKRQKYWIVNTIEEEYDNKIKSFLENNYWEYTSSSKKDIRRIKEIKKGDILLLADKSYIKYFGECKINSKNEKRVYVDGWKSFKEPLYFQIESTYIKTIIPLKNRDLLEKIFKEINIINKESQLYISTLDVDAFMSLPNGSIRFSRGINLLIGENASGKSQILKLIYSVIEANNEIISENKNSDYEKQRIIAKNLTDIFKTEKLGNLVNKDKKESKVTLNLNEYKLSFKFGSNSSKEVSRHLTNFKQDFIYKKVVFIPVKEVLSFYKGFRIIYERKYLEFDKTYYNLCRALEEPLLKETQFNSIILELEKILDGKIEIINGRFYLISDKGKFEINLVAEGLRKIGMLAYLLSNEALDRNSILFWDEPEANMHPKLIDDIIYFLVLLANKGIQIFISTHSPYVIESLNNHLKRHKIEKLDIEDSEIKNIVPLNPKKISAYLLENNSLIDILDKELELLDDKLLHNFNDINALYEKMRDIEWDNDL